MYDSADPSTSCAAFLGLLHREYRDVAASREREPRGNPLGSKLGLFGEPCTARGTPQEVGPRGNLGEPVHRKQGRQNYARRGGSRPSG